MRRRLGLGLVGLVLALGAFSGARAATAESPITVAQLLGDGWAIVGYVGTADVRSTLILFRHKDPDHLVQCSVFYDVTRSPREVTNCYEIH